MKSKWVVNTTKSALSNLGIMLLLTTLITFRVVSLNTSLDGKIKGEWRTYEKPFTFLKNT